MKLLIVVACLIVLAAAATEVSDDLAAAEQYYGGYYGGYGRLYYGPGYGYVPQYAGYTAYAPYGYGLGLKRFARSSNDDLEAAALDRSSRQSNPSTGNGYVTTRYTGYGGNQGGYRAPSDNGANANRNYW